MTEDDKVNNKLASYSEACRMQGEENEITRLQGIIDRFCHLSGDLSLEVAKLREENDRLREQANLWAVKAGQVDRRALELREENGMLKGELAIKDKHLEAFGIMLDKACAEIDRLRGEAPDAGHNSLNLDDITDIYKFKGSPETKLEIKKGRV